MAYLKEGEIKAGDTVRLDGGFTCVEAGLTIVQEDSGGLWFPCSSGRHYIDGQLKKTGEYMGISAA